MDKRKLVELFEVDRLTFLAILVTLKASEFKAVMCKLDSKLSVLSNLPLVSINDEVFRFSKRKSTFLSDNKEEIKKLLG